MMVTVALGLRFIGFALGSEDVDVSRCAADPTGTQCQSDNMGLLQSKLAVTTDDAMSPPSEDDPLEQPSSPRAMRAKAKALRDEVWSCLEDRLNDTAGDAPAANEKRSKLEKVWVAEVYKLMQQRGIPLTALPDLAPFSPDANVADALIMVGQDAAEDIVQEEFNTALDLITKAKGGVTKADLGKLAERIVVFLEMCGDQKEAVPMSDKIKALGKKEVLTGPETEYMLKTASYVSNKCQLDSLDIGYFVGNAGPGEVKHRPRTHCNSLISSSMLSVREQNRMRLEMHSTGDTKEYVLSATSTIREEYCTTYSDFAAAKPTHWISKSTDIKAYVDCFCTRRQPEMVCREEHAAELATVQSQVEAILSELPDPSMLAQPLQDALLETMANKTEYIPLGPCDVPLSCEVCVGGICMTTDVHKLKHGDKYRKMETSFFSQLQGLLASPSTCFSGHCTPCMGIKPNDPVKFTLEMGAGIDKCNNAEAVMASFKLYVKPQVCLGGKMEDVLSKIGAECKSLGELAWYPFISKIDAHVNMGPGSPIPVPLTKVQWVAKLVLGDISEAYKAICRNKGYASENHKNCLKSAYEARGNGQVGLKIVTGHETEIGWGSFKWKIENWKTWWDSSPNWKLSSYDFNELAMQGSKNNNQQYGMGNIRTRQSPHKCLDSSVRDPQRGQTVKMWDCDRNNIAQQWDKVPVTEKIDRGVFDLQFQFKRRGTNLCLDAKGCTTSGCEPHLYTCHPPTNENFANQVWQMWHSTHITARRSSGQCLAFELGNAKPLFFDHCNTNKHANQALQHFP